MPSRRETTSLGVVLCQLHPANDKRLASTDAHALVSVCGVFLRQVGMCLFQAPRPYIFVHLCLPRDIANWTGAFN